MTDEINPFAVLAGIVVAFFVYGVLTVGVDISVWANGLFWLVPLALVFLFFSSLNFSLSGITSPVPGSSTGGSGSSTGSGGPGSSTSGSGFSWPKIKWPKKTLSAIADGLWNFSKGICRSIKKSLKFLQKSYIELRKVFEITDDDSFSPPLTTEETIKALKSRLKALKAFLSIYRASCDKILSDIFIFKNEVEVLLVSFNDMQYNFNDLNSKIKSAIESAEEENKPKYKALLHNYNFEGYTTDIKKILSEVSLIEDTFRKKLNFLQDAESSLVIDDSDLKASSTKLDSVYDSVDKEFTTDGKEAFEHAEENFGKVQKFFEQLKDNFSKLEKDYKDFLDRLNNLEKDDKNLKKTKDAVFRKSKKSFALKLKKDVKNHFGDCNSVKSVFESLIKDFSVLNKNYSSIKNDFLIFKSKLSKYKSGLNDEDAYRFTLFVNHFSSELESFSGVNEQVILLNEKLNEINKNISDSNDLIIEADWFIKNIPDYIDKAMCDRMQNSLLVKFNDLTQVKLKDFKSESKIFVLRESLSVFKKSYADLKSDYDKLSNLFTSEVEKFEKLVDSVVDDLSLNSSVFKKNITDYVLESRDLERELNTVDSKIPPLQSILKNIISSVPGLKKKLLSFKTDSQDIKNDIESYVDVCDYIIRKASEFDSFIKPFENDLFSVKSIFNDLKSNSDSFDELLSSIGKAIKSKNFSNLSVLRKSFADLKSSINRRHSDLSNISFKGDKLNKFSSELDEYSKLNIILNNLKSNVEKIGLSVGEFAESVKRESVESEKSRRDSVRSSLDDLSNKIDDQISTIGLRLDFLNKKLKPDFESLQRKFLALKDSAVKLKLNLDFSNSFDLLAADLKFIDVLSLTLVKYSDSFSRLKNSFNKTRKALEHDSLKNAELQLNEIHSGFSDLFNNCEKSYDVVSLSDNLKKLNERYVLFSAKISSSNQKALSAKELAEKTARIKSAHDILADFFHISVDLIKSKQDEVFTFKNVGDLDSRVVALKDFKSEFDRIFPLLSKLKSSLNSIQSSAYLDASESVFNQNLLNKVNTFSDYLDKVKIALVDCLNAVNIAKKSESGLGVFNQKWNVFVSVLESVDVVGQWPSLSVWMNKYVKR